MSLSTVRATGTLESNRKTIALETARATMAIPEVSQVYVVAATAATTPVSGTTSGVSQMIVPAASLEPGDILLVYTHGPATAAESGWTGLLNDNPRRVWAREVGVGALSEYTFNVTPNISCSGVMVALRNFSGSPTEIAAQDGGTIPDLDVEKPDACVVAFLHAADGSLADSFSADSPLTLLAEHHHFGTGSYQVIQSTGVATYPVAPEGTVSGLTWSDAGGGDLRSTGVVVEPE